MALKLNSPDELITKHHNAFFYLNVNNINTTNRIEESSFEDGASPTLNFKDKHHGFYRDKEGYLMCER